MDIKEVRRRVMCTTDEGIACGPVSSTAIEGEIVIDDEGKEVYLHGQWVLEAHESILVEATNESVYDIYERMDINSDEFDAMIKEIEEIRKTTIDENTARNRYGAYIDALAEMIIEKIKDEGLYDRCFSDYDDYEIEIHYYKE